ncbi:Six-hairpin glycosidase [Panaeolus papilionaceus]|nr:Six-hairpin glycosidase [Panaeolus papilionaceus]
MLHFKLPLTLKVLIPIQAFFVLRVFALAPKGEWDSFNYAPKSKTVYPVAIHSQQGSVTDASHLVGSGGGKATLLTSGSWVALDFGVEVGGLISLNFQTPISNTTSLSLSFTESPLFIRPTASDDSSYPDASTTYDGVLKVSSPNIQAGHWTQPASALRGGFRYLTLVNSGSGSGGVSISNVSCAISFMPHFNDLRAYSGYFSAKDPGFKDVDFLTKLWYAGAYTVQTNTVPLNTGRQVPFASRGSWANNAKLGVAGPIIVDGAKRDRAVWPGDMGIAVPAAFVSTNDLISTRNALDTMFAAISPNGELPESGPPLSQKGSDTYHAWTLIGAHNYYRYTGDLDWVRSIFANYTKAVQYLQGKVDDKTRLINVTGLRDWARLGGGGYNAEGSALLYQVLLGSAELWRELSWEGVYNAFIYNATLLKDSYNAHFWDEAQGMYRDNATTTLTPQDANSMAVLFNLTDSDTKKKRISDGLRKAWNNLGPVPPELPDTISPFISGIELQAHFEAGNDARALDLMHRTWGYMLYTDISVQSTLLEGFTANGSLAYRWYRGYNNDPAYTSHAHGWSAGPTPALTFYVLGLQIVKPKGLTWSVAPHIGGGLPGAEGGFETPLGWFGVNWTLQSNPTKFEITIDTPTGTSGVFTFPKELDVSKGYTLDGVKVSSAAKEISLTGGRHMVKVG